MSTVPGSAPDPLNHPGALDAAAVLSLARGGGGVHLDAGLLDRLDERRARLLAVLDTGQPVYGVNTGMGALSQQRLDADAQSRHQEALLLARSAGGPPWLTREETRAVLAVRLRTFLNGDAGVSSSLCRRLGDLLAHDLLPAVPRRSTGFAGEIIGLAHLGAALIGTGEMLGAAGATIDAGPALRAAGLPALRLGPKEGISLIEGHPTTTALAILAAADAHAVVRQATFVLAAEFAITDAARDVLDPRLARGDDTLAGITAELRRLAGTPTRSRALQPPVSFRASAQVLSHLERTVGRLDEAIERALSGITDSPAFLDDSAESGGRFVGSAGFYGYDLASHLQTTTVALLGVVELGVARLHRLMDPSVSGLTAQLSADPGPQTGISPVHKRAVGVAHQLRRQAMPATLGPSEASGGQEDVQAFSLEAAETCRAALDGAVEVMACELLAVHQSRCLGAAIAPDASRDLAAALDAIGRVVPNSPDDRPFGRDVEALRHLLTTGWPAPPAS